jgi:pimeloyl-ACP methyl ester carboxylesterase
MRSLLSNNAEKRERLILRLTSCRGDSQRDVLNAWIAYRKEHRVSRRNALRQLIAAARYHAPIRKPACPVLALASSSDQLVNARCSQHLANQWQIPLALHPSAGHDLPLDDGPWVARQVKDWVATLARD